MTWYRNISIKTPDELKIMREAGKINAEALRAAYKMIRAGVTTADINAAAEEVLKKYGVTSPFKNYPGPYPYPASTNVSINDELVHGIPGKRKVKTGDIVSVDCGTYYEGFVADSAFTAGAGEVSAEALRLMKVTEQALYMGIDKMRPGNRIGDVSAAIQQYAEGHGYYVTREYTGHGVGRAMHEGPQAPNYGTPGRGVELLPGMVIALEPMLLVGTERTRTTPDQWTVVSLDGSLCCHWEHSVAVTEDGPMILTRLADGSSPAQIAGQLLPERV
jgi:methionyl aminopeptidase